MIIFMLFVFVSNSIADDDLRQILKSPKATLQLYSTFKSGNKLKYSDGEDRLRFRLFRKNAQFVADISDRDQDATYGLNFFSTMTSDEKKQYLGLNRTQQIKETMLLHRYQSHPLSRVPSYKLWTNEGAVTEVKDQGGCGSCWAFSAVGALETSYFLGSGVLRNFAEQECLDCAYGGGCGGGWPAGCYENSQRHGGRFASTSDYKYTAKKGRCRSNSKPNAMVAMRQRNYQYVNGGEDATIAALAKAALSVCFEVTSATYQYTGGIFKDKSCRGFTNHAVTAVGYTREFILVKNSWSTWWGDQGFIKFIRKNKNCGLYQSVLFPVLSRTGRSDETPSDPATTYLVPVSEPPCRECEDDKKTVCKDLFPRCKVDYCKRNTKWLKENCAKTCNTCVL